MVGAPADLDGKTADVERCSSLVEPRTEDILIKVAKVRPGREVPGTVRGNSWDADERHAAKLGSGHGATSALVAQKITVRSDCAGDHQEGQEALHRCQYEQCPNDV